MAWQVVINSYGRFRSVLLPVPYHSLSLALSLDCYNYLCRHFSFWYEMKAILSNVRFTSSRSQTYESWTVTKWNSDEETNLSPIIFDAIIGALGLQKNRSLVSLYDRTGVCTIRTLIKNDQNDLHTGTRAEFRPFVEALVRNDSMPIASKELTLLRIPSQSSRAECTF